MRPIHASTAGAASYDSILGALAGIAIGDALGAPVEHLDEATIAGKYPGGLTTYPEESVSGWQPGRGTDDTEMALLTADSIVAKGELDMWDMAERLKVWGNGHPGIGPSTGSAVSALANGVPWFAAALPDAASSGCLPRCAPVAMLAASTDVVRQSTRCCIITHRHPSAIAAVVAQNVLLNSLIEGLDWAEALSRLAATNESSIEVDVLLGAVGRGDHLSGAAAVLVEAIRCLSTATSADGAVLRAVNMGGDTDTRGAVVGALAGARWGASALPDAWLRDLRAYDEVVASAQALTRTRHMRGRRGSA
jgi:ADP-ribosyl-[dinitrogen reductase] hydrolase